MWDPSALGDVYKVWITVYCMAGSRYPSLLMGSLVVKGLINLNTFVGMSTLLVIIQPTYIGLVSLYG